jgi:aminopeptidase N
MKTTTFEKSPKMSTYLLAFVVSDLTSIKYRRQNIFARNSLTVRNDIFPAFYSEEFLKIMEQLFSYNYTLEKLDSVAMPDHGSAMENWGLILYREHYLIVETNPHPYDNYDFIGTVTHEL